MKKFLFLFCLFFLSACGSAAAADQPSVTTETPAATRAGLLSVFSPAPAMTATATPIPSPTVDLYAELHLTETSIALYKAGLDQQQQAALIAQMQLDIQLTSDGATSQAAGTSIEQNNINVSRTETKKTQIAGTSTALMLTSTAYAPTQIAISQQQRANTIFTYGWRGIVLLFLLLIAVLILIFIYRWIEIWRFKNSRMSPNDKGQFEIVPEATVPVKKGEKVNFVNPNLAHRVDSRNDDLSAEGALRNKNYERMKEVEVLKALQPATARQNRIPVKSDGSEIPPMPAGNAQITKPEEQIQLLLTQDADQIINADWKIVNDWDCKGNMVPYGANRNGAAFVNIEENYHYGVFGATGEWKSRGFLRPFMAALLASGHRAIILGKTGDFWMFESHPNVNLIAVRDVTEKSEARRYADYLQRMTKEMNLRDEWLTSRHQSTWERAGRENTFIVLDEVGNALEQMPKMERDDCMRWIVSLVKQGRKNGFNVITASQRAVGFKNVVEQMSRVVYRLSDEMSSRIALGRSGAEYLPRNSGKFFSNFSSIELCASFMPTDEQLISFLHSRPVAAHEPLNWIDGVAQDVPITNDKTTFANSEPTYKSTDAKKKADDAAKIVEMYQAYLNRQEKPSLAEIERVVYGGTGGSFHNNVKRVIAEFEGVEVDELADVIAKKVDAWSTTSAPTSAPTSTATTEKKTEIGGFSVVAE